MVLLTLGLAAASAPALAQGDDSVVYTIKRGDTLDGLARSYLLGPRLSGRLGALNRVADPRRLPVGSALRIPRRFLKSRPVELKVRSFSGPVTIGKDASAPKAGMVLGEGAEIRTGREGFVTLESNDGARVVLPSNTHAQLLRSRRYVLGNQLDFDFRVITGRGEASAPKLKQGDRYRLQTPSAVSAVRGTRFRIAHDGETGVGSTAVDEGEVRVSGAAASLAAREVATPAGFGVTASAQGISQLRELLPAPALTNAGQVQTDEMVSFGLAPVPGASGYVAQVASDAGFSEVISEAATAAPAASFPGIANGRFFVRARAVSAEGLAGLAETYSFKRKRLGAAASVENSPLADGYKFSWAPEGGGNTAFALQLWNAATPEALLIDETGLSGQGLVITSLQPGRYQWRVAALQADGDGLLKVWGPTQSLTVTGQ